MLTDFGYAELQDKNDLSVEQLNTCSGCVGIGRHVVCDCRVGR